MAKRCRIWRATITGPISSELFGRAEQSRVQVPLPSLETKAPLQGRARAEASDVIGPFGIFGLEKMGKKWCRKQDSNL